MIVTLTLWLIVGLASLAFVGAVALASLASYGQDVALERALVRADYESAVLVFGQPVARQRKRHAVEVARVSMPRWDRPTVLVSRIISIGYAVASELASARGASRVAATPNLVPSRLEKNRSQAKLRSGSYRLGSTLASAGQPPIARLGARMGVALFPGQETYGANARTLAMVGRLETARGRSYWEQLALATVAMARIPMLATRPTPNTS